MAPQRSKPPIRPSLRAPTAGVRLLNLGPVTSAWLADIGIRTREDLARVGAIEACRRMRAAGHSACLNAAYAIEAGLRGDHWQALPPEIKRDLAARFAVLKADERRERKQRG